MANTAIIDLITQAITNYFSYMLPIIAYLAGIVFMVSFLMSVTMGLGRRTFRG